MTGARPWPCMECRIMMEIVDDDHCSCPKCGTEVWFRYGEPVNGQKDKEALTTNPYISRSLPEGYRVPPGGAKSGKRAKKKGTKKFTDNGFEGF